MNTSPYKRERYIYRNGNVKAHTDTAVNGHLRERGREIFILLWLQVCIHCEQRVDKMPVIVLN